MEFNNTYCLLITTCNRAEVAENIASKLVEEQLAACVNIIEGGKSVYQWQQKLEIETELLLIIKTSKQLINELEIRLKQLHPYELPEIIAVPIESGSNEYLNWLSENLK